MRINNNISFCAKKPIIRNLDDINRKFIRDYSFVKSPTKLLTHFEKKSESILEEKNVKYRDLANLWDCKVILLREKKIKDIQELALEVQKSKTANCQEMCEILFEKLSQEGHKPKLAVFDIETTNEARKMRDHMFLIINPKNSITKESLIDTNSIIVDPFFGFVDYAPNATRRFSNELGLKKDEKLKFKILD